MKENDVDIYKAAGILIKDRKLLVAHTKGKKFFTAPGGVVEPGETVKQALVRELKEEVDILVDESDLEIFGTFFAQAAGQEDKFLKMDVFLVKNWQREIKPSNGAEEIDEIRWITSQINKDISLGSIFQHEVLPRLKKMDLID